MLLEGKGREQGSAVPLLTIRPFGIHYNLFIFHFSHGVKVIILMLSRLSVPVQEIRDPGGPKFTDLSNHDLVHCFFFSVDCFT
jgi:hypothetical protein